MFNLDQFLECFRGWVKTNETEMLLIIILSIWNVSKVCTLCPPKSTRKSTSFYVKILSYNSPLAPQFSKYRKLLVTSHIKLDFGEGGLRFYTPVINLIMSGWSVSDWYGAIVILIAKIHFALTIPIYETPLWHRFLKKFKTRSIVMSLVVTINDSHCLIHMLYLVLVLSSNDVFNILTVVSLLPW